MERTKLKAARLDRRMTQPQLAKAIGYSKEALSMWERGEATPHDDAILALCLYFGKNPADLDLASELTESELAMLQDILKNRTVGRRQALAIMTLPAFAGIDFSTLSKPLMSPEQFLRQAGTSIKACWQLMKGDGISTAEDILAEYVPPLANIAVQPSRLQALAASLATEAKILQAITAGHKLDYRNRGIYCTEAVQFGELSGENRLCMTALGYQAGMYTYYYHDPQRAIGIFREGLARTNSDTSLNKMDLSLGLSIAYAQEGDESKALGMIEQAKQAMPKHPELDPFYQVIDIGQSELEESEGRIYSYLAQKLPGSGYAQRAYETYDLSTGKQAVSARSQSRILIYKAAAALALGDLDEYTKCLGQGLLVAIQIDSKKRKDEARKILDKAPAGWKNETKYQNLTKMF